MDEDQAWQAIDTQRTRVADLLDGLSGEEWARPSLCDDWSVREVAAHLTLQQVGLRGALGMVVRSPGGMNRMIREAARRRAAAFGTDQIVAGIRAMHGSRRHNIGVTYQDTLTDILVHAQDVAVPLGRDLLSPPEAAALAATRVWGRSWPFRARRSLRGVRLIATDVAWTVGEGPEVAGPIGSLLLLLTGRDAALTVLSGDGVGRLQERTAARRASTAARISGHSTSRIE